MKVPSKYTQFEFEVRRMVVDGDYGDVRLATDDDIPDFYSVYINDLEYEPSKDTRPSNLIADLPEYHIALSLAIALGEADYFEMFLKFKPEGLDKKLRKTSKPLNTQSGTTP